MFSVLFLDPAVAVAILAVEAGVGLAKASVVFSSRIMFASFCFSAFCSPPDMSLRVYIYVMSSNYSTVENPLEVTYISGTPSGTDTNLLTHLGTLFSDGSLMTRMFPWLEGGGLGVEAEAGGSPGRGCTTSRGSRRQRASRRGMISLH